MKKNLDGTYTILKLHLPVIRSSYVLVIRVAQSWLYFA